MRTFALVPAAGHSRRMGRPKLSLPLGDSTVLGCVVAALRSADVDDVLVVVGPHVAELAVLAAASGASSLLLQNETPDMRATVERGLEWLERRHRPDDDDNVLLCPADHPALSADVVRRLVRARRADHSIVIPTHDGRRGHPALIAWRHVAGMRALPPGAGLNVYLRSRDAETFLLPVDDERVLWDLDTPADYERMVRVESGVVNNPPGG